MATGIFKSMAVLGLFLLAAKASAHTCFSASQSDLADPATSHSTLVYVWSPRMVLSAQHAADVQQQAALAGLRWVAVHDPLVPTDERLAALTQLARQHPASAHALQASLALCDAQLIARDALRHFPSAFVWRVMGRAVEPVVGPIVGPQGPAGAAAVAAQGWAGRAIVGAMPAPFWALALHERLQP